MGEYKVGPELAAELRAQLKAHLQAKGYAPHDGDLGPALDAIKKAVEDDVNGAEKVVVAKAEAEQAAAEKKAADDAIAIKAVNVTATVHPTVPATVTPITPVAPKV